MPRRLSAISSRQPASGENIMANSGPKKSTTREEWVVNVVARLFSQIDRWLLRLTGGHGSHTKWRLLGRGAPALLLTTRGRKSGQLRTTPVLYLRDEDSFVVVASKGGMPHHPLWYLNLEANQSAVIEIDGREMPVLARRATEVERQRLWPKLVGMYPNFATYQERTDREIPVVILSPR
jgi:F420H(2)-dependent quinone reductase